MSDSPAQKLITDFGSALIAVYDEGLHAPVARNGKQAGRHERLERRLQKAQKALLEALEHGLMS